MVVDDLDVVRVAVPPAEANAPSVIDAYTVLPTPIALERFQSVPWRDSQIVKALGSIQLDKFAQHDPLEGGREAAPGCAGEEALGLAVGEAPDHAEP